jgi:acylphosphatase
MTAIRVLVSGRVHGVGYRAWTVTEARKLGLSGWVRNRHDGTVEMVLSGDDGAIRRMIGACHSGPPFARVDTVIETVTDESDIPSGFEQRLTA